MCIHVFVRKRERERGERGERERETKGERRERKSLHVACI